MTERDATWVDPDPKVPPSDPNEALWRGALDHVGPWTESDFNALPEGFGVELHDGLLILTPSPAAEHQCARQTVAHYLTEAIGDETSGR
ncbi:hypothetical protein AB0I28_09860 [Phytomonospora sp. NPDC050363]|uniref:hypothetical protein n=1 Tax=Phytomonospora sp. NPDC050363 TaxID=3155642 RepID=UPI0033F6DE88